MNRSLTEPTAARGPHARASSVDRFEAAARRCQAALRRPEDPDLTRDELALLRRVAAGPGAVALTALGDALGWAKSTTSVAAKDLEQRGYLCRERRADDERRLAISLTPRGRARVDGDRLYEPARLAEALRALPSLSRARLLDALEALAAAAERLPDAGR
ncbi:MAG TPA: MarR family winged helix-turn-helix transcriptional regulator [Acidimicrobiia bacterium]